MKTIHIKKATKEESADSARLSFDVSVADREGTLYYDVEKQYADYLCDEVADGVIVTVLSYAIRGGYDIVSDVPVSIKLYYHLTEQLIPQLAVTRGAVHAPAIKAECIDPGYTPSGVAAGISCGVDSFTTLYEYTQLCQLPEYRLTHLTFFQNGAHHRCQWGYSEEHDKVFAGQLAHVSKFCQEYGYNLINVKSNVSMFLSEMFWKDSYHLTHSYRNTGFALMLQKLIRTYYYSSEFDIRGFSCAVDEDPAQYERVLLPNISTNSTTFYNSNRTYTRNDKIKLISNFPQSYNHLLVCYAEDHNCGKCVKCIRTLLGLDFLGMLDKYQNCFDVEDYRRRRNWYMVHLYANRRYDVFLDELATYAEKNNVYIPLGCKVKGSLLSWRHGLKLFLQRIVKVFR